MDISKFLTKGFPPEILSKSYRVRVKQRSAARLAATQCLYSWAMNGITPEAVFHNFLDFHQSTQPEIEIDLPYAKALYFGVIDTVDFIDSLIDAMTKNPGTQFDPIERAILRYSTYELIYNLELDAPIIINEAVELAKVLGGKGSHAFVNRYLEEIKQKIRPQFILEQQEQAQRAAKAEAEAVVEQVNDIEL